ncbi:unnamed protein product [Spirodela intermedia]|uniref:t-SNARE coiled-coil homology domain-containing protein n=1 Tax=Spirodela intermedia TaxID=51605 RepID=A0A7I8IZE6_SPIIN|nr:unnamed protein product [Spirodela intermedia]CAA6662953.1 unnamed protein product [Spirodela intermedia]
MSTARMATPGSKVAKKCSVDHGFNPSNPFDSGSDSEEETTLSKISSPHYDKDDGRGASSSSSVYPGFSATRSHYENDFRDSGGFENQSEKTTEKINSCLKIAEDIREDATKTLVTLHQQGEQITRTHLNAVNIDHDLSRGEKLLASLGGFFSKTWKPKRSSHPIKGPVLMNDDPFKRPVSHLEQKDRLEWSTPRRVSSEPSQLWRESRSVEKAKQDDKLSDLSNLLGQLKDMAVDMGSEIERQNGALGHLHDDVDEINLRVKGANLRARRLLGK